MSYSKYRSLLIGIICIPILLQAQFQGAQLRNSLQDNEVKVHLTQYFKCGFDQIPTTESVVLYETMAKGSPNYITLEKKDSYNTINNNSAPCKEIADCIQIVNYEGKTNIRNVPGGWDILWKKCCLNLQIENYHFEPNQSITLQNHISEEVIVQDNFAAFIKNPFIKGCVNFENSAFLEALDTLNNDSISITQGQCWSGNSIYQKNPETTLLGPNGVQQIAPPPYLPIEFNSGFNDESIVGVEASTGYQSQMSKYIMQVQKAGNYLLPLSIQEFRNRKIINTSQVIFITEIK